MRISIAAVLSGVGALVLVGLLIIAGSGGLALSTLRVNGPVYKQIILGKDLIADVLPPPLYVVEAFLEVNMARDDLGGLSAHETKIKQLHDVYAARLLYWRTADIPDSLRTKIVEESDQPAELFWKEIEEGFLPAARRNDRTSIMRSFQTINAAYLDHRRLVDEIVTLGNDFAANSEKEADQSTMLFTSALIIATVVILAALVVAMRYVKLKLVNPLLMLSTYMRGLGDTNYGAAVPFVERDDEIGDMARSIETFRHAIAERVALRARQKEDDARKLKALEEENRERERRSETQRYVTGSLAEALSRLAKGDLVARIDKAFPDEFLTVREDFNAAAGRLQQALRSVLNSTEAVSAGSADISTATDQLSRRSEQQAASLEESSAALHHITETLRRTSDAAAEAGRLVANTQADAVKVGAVVDDTIGAMRKVEQSSKEITQIIDVIEEIAFQTNLLALNAGVEAARAGEAGRGFAVVAQEVRALAQRSAEAADQIKRLIKSSASAVESGVTHVYGTGERLKAILTAVARIEERITSIAESAQEQSHSLHEVNTAVAEMDKITQQTAAMVEETSAAGHSLRDEAAGLLSLVSQFNVGRNDEQVWAKAS